MTKISTQSYKGARDFYPEDKQKQQWMFSKWRTVVEKFGYQEYDAPILEPTELYLMKGSSEIVNEQTYTFKDRGDRSVTIRTEMTPTVSRMVAGRRQELSYPARWYSIPNLWRYERMQRGRLREFWQLNVDMFGVSNVFAELEMIEIVDSLFREFKATRSSYVIKVNSRVLVNTMFEFVCGMNEEQTLALVRLTDRMIKMTPSEFNKSVKQITKDSEVAEKIIKLLSTKFIKDLPTELSKSPSVIELKNLLENCSSQGIRNVVFDITLMRGFDYYTDIVFEAFDTNPENSRSLLGGGRYDGLVAQFGVEPVPTIGFAVGDVGFQNFLETHKLIPKLKSKVDVVVIARNKESLLETQKIARWLRDLEINVATDITDRKEDNKYKSAIKSGVRFAVFVDSKNVNSDKMIIKDLKTSKEQVQSISRISKILKDQR